MTSYNAPLKDMSLALKHTGTWDVIKGLPGCEEVGDDLLGAILEEASKLARDVLSPLNHSGDVDGTKRADDGSVTTAKGFKEAYAQYRDAGWNSVPFPTEFGGQGLPWPLSMAINEMWQSSNMSFGLCPLLNQGAVDAIEAYASHNLQETYLPKMVSGEWTGTMNLTEPQAGSDLAQVKTKAAKQDDGTYKVSGQKIYITYGEHDMADNIIHLVLARTPDAPEGVKGISLFIVPKFLVKEDGSLGERNDVTCVGLEHKIGIHASPTCTMQYGDKGGAIGYLVGEENQGLMYMFKMMNNARLHVGLQGVSIAQMAYQKALDYAHDRPQGTDFNGLDKAPIVNHPDVQRMLLTMRALTEAGRVLTYFAGAQMDIMVRSEDKEAVSEAVAICNLLTPIVKGFGTDIGNEVASIGVQVHGGMGFIEETGAGQYFRDARILPIYEGTNGIQAKDLVFRKILKEQAPALRPMVEGMLRLAEKVKGDEQDIARALTHGADVISKSVDWIVKRAQNDKYRECEAAAYPLMSIMGYVFSHYLMVKSYIHAKENGFEDGSYLDQKIEIIRFFAKHIHPRIDGLEQTLMASDGLSETAQQLLKR